MQAMSEAIAEVAQKKPRGWALHHPVITCSWCGEVVAPRSARMRILDSQGIRCSGKWIAHFHPECGDAVLDYCESRKS
jgi:hypothetical protein